jgi:quercetin dioxygenase-like cupin family protein
MAAPTPTAQLNDLPKPTTYITGHDDSSGKAIIHSTRPAAWHSLNNNQVGFNVIYTTSEFPPSLTADQDIATHDELMASGKLGLVNPHGTTCRMVDFAPGGDALMHRTQSLDYGVVLEGSIELQLDSGETRTLHRGDIAVQRATMHAWRNFSSDKWCRMLFVLQDCQPLVIAGQRLSEDISAANSELPPSGNDA